ncbi:MAG: hypothetical protein EXR86_05015 [Gammaproteobacteria bacterium]|nr:hypothetical protein [Gammaproteobacteria bacterium]
MKLTEVHYKVPWRAAGNFPGHHASRQKGGGAQFRNHAPLLDAPDPRRFDVHASLRDPFEQLQFRVYRQTSAIPIYVVADLSASMNFVGANAKMSVVADLVACMSYSAYRTGDRFGFIGCADPHSEPVWLESTMNRAAGIDLARQLRTRPPQGSNSEGLLKAAELLGTRRALVFLVSDFHFDPTLLDEILVSLAYYDVVPVMVWDRHEYAQLPRFGIVRVMDHETGRNRLLLMRPSLRQRIEREFDSRRERLAEIFRQHGRLPLVLEDGFDADEVTHYFFG